MILLWPALDALSRLTTLELAGVTLVWGLLWMTFLLWATRDVTDEPPSPEDTL